MNREIKFRAWHKVKNIMVYDNEDDTYGYWDGCRNSNVGMINTILNSQYYKEYKFMQYTGLRDKNGKEIYEGDIAKYENMIGKIMFFNGSFILSDFEEETEWELGVINEELEIIGNIYDNPELLGGEYE